LIFERLSDLNEWAFKPSPTVLFKNFPSTVLYYIVLNLFVSF